MPAMFNRHGDNQLKMIVITVLSILAIAGFSIFFIYKNRADRLLIAAFLVKIAASILLGIIYKYHYQGGDTFAYYHESETIAKYVMSDPGKHVGFYFSNTTAEIPTLNYSEQPRALFFSKILSLIYIFTGGNYWLMTVLLGIINFLCVKEMVDRITGKFQGAKIPSFMAFYFLPTFVFWTSGMLKESLAIGALCLLVALAIEISEPHSRIRARQIIMVLIAGLVLWNLKYFYAAVAIPVLISVVVFERIESRKFRIVVPLVLLVALVVVFSTSHYNLNARRVLDVIHENYLLGIQAGHGAIAYYHFDGSISGFLINLPVAVFSGLFRPFLFEWNNLFQAMVAFENFTVFSVLIVAIWRTGVPKSLRNPWVIAAIVAILSLDIFIAFSTPNYGTLSRFKTAYWPFFVMLTICWFQQKNKSQAL
jgi:hypothetical protein